MERSYYVMWAATTTLMTLGEFVWNKQKTTDENVALAWVILLAAAIWPITLPPYIGITLHRTCDKETSVYLLWVMILYILFLGLYLHKP